MKALKRAVALRPGTCRGGASYNLGTVLRVAGRNDEALPYFRQALQQNPRHFEAHNNLAGVLTALNRKSDAIAHFKAAIGSNPGYAAGAFQPSKRFAVGRRSLSRPRRITEPRSSTIRSFWTPISGLALRSARTRRARGRDRNSAKQAIALNPQSSEAHGHLGLCLREANRYAEALEQYKTASGAAAPARGLKLSSILQACTDQAAHDYDTACRHYADAIKLHPTTELAAKTRIDTWPKPRVSAGRPEEADRQFDRRAGPAPRTISHALEAKKRKGRHVSQPRSIPPRAGRCTSIATPVSRPTAVRHAPRAGPAPP